MFLLFLFGFCWFFWFCFVCLGFGFCDFFFVFFVWVSCFDVFFVWALVLTSCLVWSSGGIVLSGLIFCGSSCLSLFLSRLFGMAANGDSLRGYSEGGDDGDSPSSPQQKPKSNRSVPYDFVSKTALEPQMCDLSVEQLQVC